MKSQHFIPSSGVPQGSSLATLLFAIFINDLAIELGNSALFFADDVKLITEIKSSQDVLSMQQQINKVVNWCNLNNIDLNISKCAILSYYKSKNPVIVDYFIQNQLIQRVSVFRDLGVYFDTALTFKQHISEIATNAFKSAGFIMRNCGSFSNIQTLKILFNTLVRSKLEYASTVWSPYKKYQIAVLESVQRRFLKFLYLKKNGRYPQRGCNQNALLHEFGMEALEQRRTVQDVKFISGLCRANIDCSFLLGRIDFYVPRINSLARATFYIRTAKRDSKKYSPLNRMCTTVNSCRDVLDIFNVDPTKITLKSLQM